MNSRPSGVEDNEPRKGSRRAAPPSPSSRTFRQKAGLILLVLLLAGIAVARIASTYTLLSSTHDEPSHIARGMEWLTTGSYSYFHHPPLAPVAIGLGPYLDGARYEFVGDKKADGRAILHFRDAPVRNLTLARIGVLPFLLLASACVWWWSRRLFGDPTALIATLLFTTLPVVLAHSGVATSDMAITATSTLALLAFTSWLDRPTLTKGAAAGIAAGLALLSKFSALVFLPVGALAIVAVRWLAQRRGAELAGAGAGARARSLGFGALLAFAMVWGGYQFSVGSPESHAFPWRGNLSPSPTPVSMDPQLYRMIDYVFGAEGTLHDVADGVARFPATPAPEYLLGVMSTAVQQVNGNAPYFLGEMRHDEGSWLFFPVALGVKTPLAFLVLMLMGMYFLVRAFWSDKDWRRAVPLVVAVAILLVVLPSDVNMGVRHVLPVYPLLAIVAAYGTVRIWKAHRYRAFTRIATTALVGWHLASSAAAHPDYLSYFNEMAGDHPERILIGSGYGWGQNVKRLAEEFRARNIDEVYLYAHGGHSLRRQELPRVVKQLLPYKSRSGRPSGWIAIDLTALKAINGFSWLERFEPMAKIRGTIWLYYIPPPESPDSDAAERKSGKDHRAPSPE